MSNPIWHPASGPNMSSRRLADHTALMWRTLIATVTPIVVGEQTGQGSEAAKLYIFENQDGRGGQWRKHVVHTGDEHHHGSVVIDIDNDGDLDLISIGLRHSLVLLTKTRRSHERPVTSTVSMANP